MGRLPGYQGDFVEAFRELLEERLAERSSAGSRTALATPLEEAIRRTVARMGGRDTGKVAWAEVRVSRKSEKTTTKRADVSFASSDKPGSVSGIVEVKVGLDPNSLGAAVMEGLLFKHAGNFKQAKFFIVSLYARSDDHDDAEKRARQFLRACGLAKMTDGMSIHVLSFQPGKVDADRWNKRFARGVKRLVTDIRATLTH